jgi:hypothetical protein
LAEATRLGLKVEELHPLERTKVKRLCSMLN